LTLFANGGPRHQRRRGNLKIYYPKTTLWSDHPIALLRADWVKPEQAQAARTFVTHLKSVAVQKRALAYGFRPTDPAVPLETPDANNPSSIWTIGS